VKRTTVIPWEASFDASYGLQILDLGASEVRAQVAVTDAVRQPMGLVHGGVYAAMAESMASWGTAHGAPEGTTVMGLSNQTSFLRPILAGSVHAVARVRHRGATTCVWDVEITDDEDRLCALVRMTIAIRVGGDRSPDAPADAPVAPPADQPR
jgi:1,4-dihydroxy-2-naphthoyl-CoA hydrolase